MLIGRRYLHVILAVVCSLSLISSATAQDAASDQAKLLLKQGAQQYKVLKFKQAQTTLLKASAILKSNASALSAAEKKELDDYLAKVPNAIRRQAAAQEAYRSAEKALAAGRLDDAIQGFARAATNEFLDGATRRDARAQLALAQKRKEVVAIATTVPTPKPAPATKPVPKPTPKPAPKPTPKPAPKPALSPVSRKMMADMEARMAKALQLLSMGKRALRDQKIDMAVQYFQRAKDLDPDLAEADQLLRHTSKLVALKTVSRAGILSRLERRNLIAKQAATVEINKAIERTRDALASASKEADFDNADQAARLAGETLEANKSFFEAMGYRNERARIDGLLDTIAKRRDTFNKRKASAQAREVDRIKAKRLLDQQRRTLRKISSLSEQARAHRRQKEYDRALEIVQQILLIDPRNRWAEKERDFLTEFGLLMKDTKAMRTQRVEESKVQWDLKKAEVPWYEYLRYPKNWKQLTEDRKEFQASAAGESAADAALREKLQREIERLSFTDIDFKDVVQFLREYSDANIHVNWRALQAAGIEQTTKVSVDVRKITVKRALDLILRDVSGAAAGADAELRYVINGGVLTISTKADLAREPIRRVYDIRDLLVPIPDFSGPRIELAEASQESLNVGRSSSSTSGIFEDDTTTAGGKDEEEEITKEKLTEDFISLVKNAIDRDSWGDAEGGGAGAGFIQVLNGQLVVTQTAENHQALSELIEKLREAKTIQIMVEARFISVNSGFLSSVGVDLDFYFNVGSNMTRPDGAVVTDPWTGSQVPTYTGVGGQTSNFPTYSATGPWPVRAGSPSGNRKWSPVGVKQGSAGFISGMQTGVGGDIGKTLSSMAPALSIGGTFLDDIQVDFLVQATQAHVSTRVLTAPKITMSNSQRAYITVARQQAYIREYIPVVSGNATAYRPVIAYIPTGAVLDVAATASADRRYVMMTIRPQVSQQLDDPIRVATSGGDIFLPNVSVQDLQTTVSVPDGGTLLLGGQRLAGESEREMGAPVLSKIPIINRLFDNRGTVRDEQTLLILVKPKIMINEQAERNERLYLEEPRLP